MTEFTKPAAAVAGPTEPPADAPARAEPAEQERFLQAGPWRLVWWRFRKHRLARISLVVLILMYVVAAFAEFFSPYGATERFEGYNEAAPTRIHLFHDGDFRGPFVYGRSRQLSMETFRQEYVEDRTRIYPVRLLARGEPYKLAGLIPTDRHLFGTGPDAAPVFVFGSDRLGRDLLSRIIAGSRISLTIGLFGVLVGFLIGITLGAISGYFGGFVDTAIQRLVEFVLALPTIPLWMAMSAALPRDWSVVQTYFVITLILSLVSWATLAREVRGKLLALREEDFVTAARLAGASRRRIMFVHLLPSFSSHLVVVLTLAIPGMILGETALSFIGLGLQPPAVSWGVLLQDAQNVVAVSLYPWQLIPAAFVVVTVLMFNFLGDGLRDAADPYSS